MKKTSLVIMAAGIGSRFGGGVKQLSRFGRSGELIIDFSIYDAIKAGFNKIVFIIRHEIEADFKEAIGNRISEIIEVHYVYQELSKLPNSFETPEERTKPWGTGHAILCCKEIINEPFAVINADDYYGRDAFFKAYKYLNEAREASSKLSLCMVSFILEKTLSKNGRVTRGICTVDENGLLSAVNETYGIERGEGCAVSVDTGEEISLDSLVSMNFWGFYPEIFSVLEDRFSQFLKKLEDVKGQEFLLPTIVGELLKADAVNVRALHSCDEWFGITYKEDIPEVREAIERLVDTGVYPEKLF